MAFAELVLIEWLLLLAAGITFMGGTRGVFAATVLLSGIVWATQPTRFLIWEIPLLIGVALSLAILWWFVRKAGKSELVIGLAGGIASLVVFGAFFTPILAIISWALIIGTGLIPRINTKQILWGIAPMLWRIVMGLGWLVLGNILI